MAAVARFRGQLFGSAMSRMEVRKRLRKFSDLRISIRNPQTFSLGGPNYDIDFALMGPDLESLLALVHG